MRTTFLGTASDESFERFWSELPTHDKLRAGPRICCLTTESPFVGVIFRDWCCIHSYFCTYRYTHIHTYIHTYIHAAAAEAAVEKEGPRA